MVTVTGDLPSSASGALPGFRSPSIAWSPATGGSACRQPQIIPAWRSASAPSADFGAARIGDRAAPDRSRDHGLPRRRLAGDDDGQADRAVHDRRDRGRSASTDRDGDARRERSADARPDHRHARRLAERRAGGSGMSRSAGWSRDGRLAMAATETLPNVFARCSPNVVNRSQPGAAAAGPGTRSPHPLPASPHVTRPRRRDPRLHAGRHPRPPAAREPAREQRPARPRHLPAQRAVGDGRRHAASREDVVAGRARHRAARHPARRPGSENSDVTVVIRHAPDGGPARRRRPPGRAPRARGAGRPDRSIRPRSVPSGRARRQHLREFTLADLVNQLTRSRSCPHHLPRRGPHLVHEHHA